MAARSTVGKLGVQPNSRRPQWGVRGNLFAAFAVIAGIAIIISVVASLVLTHNRATMMELSGRDIPRLVTGLQLSGLSSSSGSQGASLLQSENVEALNDRVQKMKETVQA